MDIVFEMTLYIHFQNCFQDLMIWWLATVNKMVRIETSLHDFLILDQTTKKLYVKLHKEKISTFRHIYPNLFSLNFCFVLKRTCLLPKYHFVFHLEKLSWQSIHETENCFEISSHKSSGTSKELFLAK